MKNLGSVESIHRWLPWLKKARHLWIVTVIVLIASYWLSPRDWWSVYTFLCTGILSIIYSFERLFNFLRVQRQPSKLLFFFTYFVQGIALIGGAFIVAPHPMYDFEWMRFYTRLLWGIALPAFAVAVHFAVMWLVVHLTEVALREQEKKEYGEH